MFTKFISIILLFFSFSIFAVEESETSKESINVEVSLYKGRKLVPDKMVAFVDSATMTSTINKMEKLYKKYTKQKEEAKNVKNEMIDDKKALRENGSKLDYAQLKKRERSINSRYNSKMSEINNEVDKIEDDLKTLYESHVEQARIAHENKSDFYLVYKTNKNGQFVATFPCKAASYVVMTFEPINYDGSTTYVFYKLFVDKNTNKITIKNTCYKFDNKL